MILTGITNRRIIWDGDLLHMIQYRIPVRLNTPQYIQYTFKDETGAVIDLSDFGGVVMQMKLDGQLFASISAAYSFPRTLGQVYMNYSFAQIGTWAIQFLVQNNQNETELFGEPVQFRVVPNVENLSLGQLPIY